MNTNVTTQSKIAHKFSQNPEIKNLTQSIDGKYPVVVGSLRCEKFYRDLMRTDACDGALWFFQETSLLNNNL